MNKIKEEKILMVAKYIIENNATIEATAAYFGISTSSVKKYINNKENLQSIDYNAYLVIKEIQKELQINGRINGGKIGKRTSSITDYELEEIATVMIEKQMTLEQASIYFDDIPTSTLYENLMKLKNEELKSKLQTLFEENNKSKGGRR